MKLEIPSRLVKHLYRVFFKLHHYRSVVWSDKMTEEIERDRELFELISGALEVDHEDSQSPGQGREASPLTLDERRERLAKGLAAYKSSLPKDRNKWYSPPRQLPRAGELAMGAYYDPDWNTR